MKFTLALSLLAVGVNSQPTGFYKLSPTTALSASKAALPVGGNDELTVPFNVAPNLAYKRITDRWTLNATGSFPATFGLWDMVTFAAPEDAKPGQYPAASENIFIPVEEGAGAGVFRYNVASKQFFLLAVGKGGGDPARNTNPLTWNATNDEYTRIDPATYTPFNTLLIAEETTGGRIFEITNPLATNPKDANMRWLSNIPALAHEGIRFDIAGNMYVVDEFNSGSIYMFVPTVKGNLTSGQTFVLKVTAFTGNASLNFDLNTVRTGPATWIPITNADGTKATTADPFAFGNKTGGRDAADEVGGTPYGRPEDIIISNYTGKEILYFTATSEHITYSVILSNPPEVKIFCSRNTTDLATNLPVGSAFSSPDNLAIDSNGHVYVIEDQGPPAADIWQAVDANGDGVAESMARWLTLGVTGAEPTGLIFDPNDIRRAVVAIQHPSSLNDALWEVTFPGTPVAAPVKAPVTVPVPAPIPVPTTGFYRLTASTAMAASKAALPVGGTDELTVPLDVAPNLAYKRITDRWTLNATGSFPVTFGVWDMVTFAAPEDAKPGQYPAASENIFIPIEESFGAGVFRYNVASKQFFLLAVGKGGGDAARNTNPLTWNATNDEYTRIDPATYTPFNTLLIAEETTGGRIFEITNPLATNPKDANMRWLSNIPALAHEGIRFDIAGNMYVVDEFNSGSIYKFVPTVKGNLASGQTFVLKVTAFTGNPAANFDFNTVRTGPATWIPITKPDGTKATTTDPFAFGNKTGGRDAADEVGGTPYGRPEDIIISNYTGKETLYFTATSEHITYSVILSNPPEVKIFCSRNTTDIATGLPVGTNFSSPDNLAIDSNGHVYVIEDQGPPAADIWQAVDANGDGVAEYMARWLSLGVTGAEPTGLIFDPNDIRRAVVAIQHPNSLNDALWEVTFPGTPVAPPVKAPVLAPAAPVTAPVASPVAAPVLAPAVPPTTPVTPTTPVAPVPATAPLPVPTPVKAPVTVPSSSVATPTLAPTRRRRCGLFRLSLFCLNGCGIFGRLFKFCRQ